MDSDARTDETWKTMISTDELFAYLKFESTPLTQLFRIETSKIVLPAELEIGQRALN